MDAMDLIFWLMVALTFILAPIVERFKTICAPDGTIESACCQSCGIRISEKEEFGEDGEWCFATEEVCVECHLELTYDAMDN